MGEERRKTEDGEGEIGASEVLHTFSVHLRLTSESRAQPAAVRVLLPKFRFASSSIQRL